MGNDRVGYYWSWYLGSSGVCYRTADIVWVAVVGRGLDHDIGFPIVFVYPLFRNQEAWGIFRFSHCRNGNLLLCKFVLCQTRCRGSCVRNPCANNSCRSVACCPWCYRSSHHASQHLPSLIFSPDEKNQHERQKPSERRLHLQQHWKCFFSAYLILNQCGSHRNFCCLRLKRSLWWRGRRFE